MSVQKVSSKDRKKALREKMKHDAKTRDSGGGGNRLLDLDAFPDVNFFKPKVGTNLISIVPFIYQTERFKKVNKYAVPGNEEYVLDVWAHTFIGTNQDSFVCLNKTFNKACPICEEIAELQKAGQIDKATLDKIKPKRRVIYNVIDLNDEAKGIQLFEVSHFLFAHELLEEAETGPDSPVFFYELDEGKDVQFKAVETAYKGRKGLKFKNFTFKDRDAFDESILDDSYPLDKMLKVLTYEEMRNAFYGFDADDDEGDDVEPRHRDDDDDEDKPRSGKTIKRKPAKEKDEEPEDEPEQDPDDEDKADAKDEPDEEEEKPSKPIRRKPAKEKDEEPEEDPDDEPEDKPKKKSTTKCPSGHEFGTDCDEHKECKRCDKWEDCADVRDGK